MSSAVESNYAIIDAVDGIIIMKHIPFAPSCVLAYGRRWQN